MFFLEYAAAVCMENGSHSNMNLYLASFVCERTPNGFDERTYASIRLLRRTTKYKILIFVTVDDFPGQYFNIITIWERSANESNIFDKLSELVESETWKKSSKLDVTFRQLLHYQMIMVCRYSVSLLPANIKSNQSRIWALALASDNSLALVKPEMCAENEHESLMLRRNRIDVISGDVYYSPLVASIEHVTKSTSTRKSDFFFFHAFHRTENDIFRYFFLLFLTMWTENERRKSQ